MLVHVLFLSIGLIKTIREILFFDFAAFKTLTSFELFIIASYVRYKNLISFLKMLVKIDDSKISSESTIFSASIWHFSLR